MILGIDAFNIRGGGGVTHLVELLAAADPARHGFSKVIVWTPTATRNRLPVRPWLDCPTVAELDGSLLHRAMWHRRSSRQAQLAAGCDIVFAPGGIASGGFKPSVAMSQNLLPFAPREALRYGLSAMTLKLFLLRLAQLRSFRKAQGIVFLSRFAARTILPLLSGSHPETAIVPHGVNDAFRHAPRPQVEGFSPDRPCRILYVSIVSPYKHHWQVVEAVASLRRQGYQVQLDLIGPRDRSAGRLEAAMRSADPSGSFVTWHGAVPYDALPARYAQADIGLFASSCENMPNILLEGMAAGLPMACSDRGPMPEVLGESGVYFNPEQPSSIAAAIQRLFSDSELRQTMAQGAYYRAQGFSWTQCADETFEFLARIARQQQARDHGDL